MTPVLEVDVRRRFGEFRLDAAFRSDGRLTALFGRSGAGKTSLVHLISGLAPPDEGRVIVDGQPLVDTAKNFCLPAHRRRIGYVFQEARLFPHLNVRQNLLFGRWFAPRRETGGASFEEVVELLGVGPLVGRRPAGLSGGEKQRIAIGRALLARPRLLLMDEPLASLDDERKAEILPYIERLRDATLIPIIYVSHSVTEVARLAQTLVVMDHGRVAATGSAAELLARLDIAALSQGVEAGALIEAAVGERDEKWGLTRLETRAGPVYAPGLRLARGGRARLRIFASDVLLSLAPLEGVSALNALAGTIVEIAPRGDGATADVRIDCSGEILIARVTAKSVAALGLAPGAPVHAVIKSVSVDSLAGAGGMR